MKESEISNVKFVKTILMLLIILGHACDNWAGNWFTETPAIESNGLSILATWLNSFHIFAFTLISGYLFAFKILRGGYGNYFKFLQNKAKRLLIPYVFSMLIWVAPLSVYFFNYEMDYLIKKYVLCINPGQLWFLWMLFGVFVFVWPFRNLMIEKPSIGWLIAFVFYGVGSIGGHIIPNIFCIWTACKYVVFFYVGMRLRVKSEKKENLFIEKIPWFGWVVADLLLFVGSLRITGRGVMAKLIAMGLSFMLHAVGAVMAWIVLQMLSNHVQWKESRGFNKLSTYSMPMYLFHQQIIYFSLTILDGVVSPWINAGVNFIVATVGAYIISAILMKWKITRFLVGEKLSA